MLLKYGLTETSSCGFYKLKDETALHHIIECNIVHDLWNKLKVFFSGILEIPGFVGCHRMSFSVICTIFNKIHY